jgi:hypothetical protein
MVTKLRRAMVIGAAAILVLQAVLLGLVIYIVVHGGIR